MSHEPVTSKPADMKVDEIASAHAPLIFFDGVPSFGINGGIANITLEAVTFSAREGDVSARRVTVAHIRTSLAGIGYLKAAIEGVELLAQPTYGGRAKAS